MNKAGGLFERAQQFFQRVWNERDDAAVYEFVSTDVVAYGLSSLSSISSSLDDYFDFRRRFLDAFPDAKFLVDNIAVEGEKVAVRYRVHATHLGDGWGFPATGRKVRINAMEIARWRDGKIVESWHNLDQLGLLRQLGKAD